MQRPHPTQRERNFSENEIIVSKTDMKGRMLYVNDVFCRVGMYEESDVIGKPHSLVRHPDMPRIIFHLLWEHIQRGQEIFAYVKNLAKNGDYYWVLAHVTPSRNEQGLVDGYHSTRRVAERQALSVIEPIYKKLLDAEAAPQNRQEGLANGRKMLDDILRKAGKGYDEFILGLATQGQ